VPPACIGRVMKLARDPLLVAWKVGLRSGSACWFAGEPVYRAVRQ
jgi:hypothetical protein